MEVDQDQRLTAQEAIAHEWYKKKKKRKKVTGYKWKS